MLQFFDENFQVQVKLIDLQETESERTATISTMLISFMEKHNVASKCIAFGGETQTLVVLRENLMAIMFMRF